MKKKSLLTLMLSTALVGVIAIGGTLAYLSATDDITNTFTVGTGYETDEDGNQGIYVDEEDVDNDGERTQEDQEYTDLMPGTVRTKDPTVYMVGGSVKSYVFAHLDGVDSFEGVMVDGVQAFEVGDWSSDWALVYPDTVGGKDGYYLYVGSDFSNAGYIVDVSEETEGSQCQLGEALFETISMNGNLLSLPEGDIPEITVKAWAVQAADDMADFAAALEAIVASYDASNVITP